MSMSINSIYISLLIVDRNPRDKIRHSANMLKFSDNPLSYNLLLSNKAVRSAKFSSHLFNQSSELSKKRRTSKRTLNLYYHLIKINFLSLSICSLSKPILLGIFSLASLPDKISSLQGSR